MRTFTYLRILNITHNDFSRDFCTVFCFLVATCAVTLIYASLKAFVLVSIMVYILFPSIGFFAFLYLTVFYSYIYMWERKSRKLLRLLRCNIWQSHDFLTKTERLGLLKRLKAARPLRNQLSHFGYTSLTLSKACVYEIFNEVLLLLSF